MMLHDHLSSLLVERVEVLALGKDEATGDLSWGVERRCWGSVELTERRNLFSSVGIGARGATVLLRHDFRLTLHNALRWRGQFLCITSSVPSHDRDRLEIQAAVCDPVTVTAKPQALTGRDSLNRPLAVEQSAYTFPGVLTELYRSNESDEVLRSGTLRRALVTPKAVTLRVGDIVQAPQGGPYTIRQALDLDIWKNEYVIERKEEA